MPILYAWTPLPVLVLRYHDQVLSPSSACGSELWLCQHQLSIAAWTDYPPLLHHRMMLDAVFAGRRRPACSPASSSNNASRDPATPRSAPASYLPSTYARPSAPRPNGSHAVAPRPSYSRQGSARNSLVFHIDPTSAEIPLLDDGMSGRSRASRPRSPLADEYPSEPSTPGFDGSGGDGGPAAAGGGFGGLGGMIPGAGFLASVFALGSCLLDFLAEKSREAFGAGSNDMWDEDDNVKDSVGFANERRASTTSADDIRTATREAREERERQEQEEEEVSTRRKSPVESVITLLNEAEEDMERDQERMRERDGEEMGKALEESVPQEEQEEAGPSGTHHEREPVPELDSMPTADTRPPALRHLSKSFANLRSATNLRRSPSLPKLIYPSEREAEIKDMLRQAQEIVEALKQGPVQEDEEDIEVQPVREASEADDSEAKAEMPVETAVEDALQPSSSRSFKRSNSIASARSSIHGFPLDEVAKAESLRQRPESRYSFTPTIEAEEEKADQAPEPPKEEEPVRPDPQMLRRRYSEAIAHRILNPNSARAAEQLLHEAEEERAIERLQPGDVHPALREEPVTSEEKEVAPVAAVPVDPKPESIKQALQRPASTARRESAPPPTPPRRASIRRSVTSVTSFFRPKGSKSRKGSATSSVFPPPDATELTPPPTPPQQDEVTRPKSAISSLKQQVERRSGLSVETTESGVAKLAEKLATEVQAKKDVAAEQAPEMPALERRSSHISVASSCKTPEEEKAEPSKPEKVEETVGTPEASAVPTAVSEDKEPAQEEAIVVPEEQKEQAPAEAQTFHILPVSEEAKEEMHILPVPNPEEAREDVLPVPEEPKEELVLPPAEDSKDEMHILPAPEESKEEVHILLEPVPEPVPEPISEDTPAAKEAFPFPEPVQAEQPDEEVKTEAPEAPQEPTKQMEEAIQSEPDLQTIQEVLTPTTEDAEPIFSAPELTRKSSHISIADSARDSTDVRALAPTEKPSTPTSEAAAPEPDMSAPPPPPTRRPTALFSQTRKRTQSWFVNDKNRSSSTSSQGGLKFDKDGKAIDPDTYSASSGEKSSLSKDGRRRSMFRSVSDRLVRPDSGLKDEVTVGDGAVDDGKSDGKKEGREKRGAGKRWGSVRAVMKVGNSASKKEKGKEVAAA